MKLHISEQAQSAGNVYLQKEHGFNRKFDGATCEESVSLMIEPNSNWAWCANKAAASDDPKGLLAYYVCCFLGRAADLDRVRAVGVRMHPGDKMEVRLKFGPPWWWDQARQHLQGAVV